jgi:two-component system, NtrC family, sensor kinase
MKQLALFLIFFSSYTFAQSNISAYTAKIDSVQQLLTTQPKDDTIKVRRLNDLALLCLIDMQFKRGMLAAKQARQLSQKLNYTKGEGLYLNFIRLITGGGNSYFSYYLYLKKLLLDAVIKEKEEPNQLMALMPQTRDYKKLEAQLLLALKEFGEVNDKEMMAYILVVISNYYQFLNKTNESIQHADGAIKLFKETGQPELAFLVSFDKIYALQGDDKIKEGNKVEKEAIAVISKTNDVREKALLHYFLGYFYRHLLDKGTLGFEYQLKAEYELEKLGEQDFRAIILNDLGDSFDNIGLHQKSMEFFNKAIELKIESQNTDEIALNYISIVFQLIELKKLDEAKMYLEKAKSNRDKIKDKSMLTVFDARYHDATGQLLMAQGKYQEALTEFILVNKIAKEAGRERYFVMYMNSYIALCYYKLGDLKKSIFFGEKSYEQCLPGEIRMKIKNSSLLAEVYEESGQFKKAFEYLKKYKRHIKENEDQAIANLTTNLAMENLTQKNEEEKALLEKEQLIKEQENKNQRWWIFSIAAALLSSFVFLYFLYRTNQNKQKANTVLENTLSQLKSTQNQLIQKEKLASLGELTAGIAHEIQNPLNFVNNFSELSVELIEEAPLPPEGEYDENWLPQEAPPGGWGLFLGDLKLNLEKINHHGKRASSIVKGMLEHSRASTGERQLTDINALCDEYLRLSYHGMRAKDKSFNADFKTDFDENLPKINVISQDIGRVLLNLINNAFQSKPPNPQRGNSELLKVIVKTSKIESSEKAPSGGWGLISISDNGTGIPKENLEKIFQPFFTTKPTGEGTGLGLSLSYDIITKGHGGTLEVESVEGEGTTFIVKLPINN